jgi:hypothetical protein
MRCFNSSGRRKLPSELEVLQFSDINAAIKPASDLLPMMKLFMQ